MKKFEEVLNEAKEKLELVDPPEGEQQDTIDEFHPIRWAQRQIGDSIFTTGEKQGEHESTEHYQRRMMAKGYFDKAFSQYRTYESGDYTYFVVINYDLNYKNIHDVLKSKYTPTSTIPAGGLQPMLINFAGLETNQGVDNQIRYVSNCLQNLKYASHNTRKANAMFGSANKITTSKMFDTINKEKLLEILDTKLFDPAATPELPKVTDTSVDVTDKGAYDRDMASREQANSSAYPEIYKSLLDIMNATNRATVIGNPTASLWSTDRTNYINNALSMIESGIGLLKSEFAPAAPTPPPAAPSGAGTKPMAPIPVVAGADGDKTSGDDKNNKIKLIVSKITSHPDAKGLWKNQSYVQAFVEIAFNAERPENEYVDAVIEAYNRIQDSTVPMDEKENVLFDCFGIPPYPFRTDGIYNFYRAVLNEIPKTLQANGFASAGNDVFFVPKDTFDNLVKGRIGSLIKQITGNMLKKGFTKMVNYVKNRISNNEYSFKNIKTYDGG